MAIDERLRHEFDQIQERLLPLWRRVSAPGSAEHTSIVIPSLSFDQEELAKIPGVSFYEERLLFTLMRLRHPTSRVLYMSSQPIDPEIVDYYLHLLVGVPSSHAWKRLKFLNVMDDSPRPLTEKILERPRLMKRMLEWVGSRRSAYITCFNSTELEQRLAIALRVPLNAVDPKLLDLGTKSGSREAFTAAGVDHGAGTERLQGRADAVAALVDLVRARPGLERAVVKLDQSFSGEGNALLDIPNPLPTDDVQCGAAIDAALNDLIFNAEEEDPGSFFRKMSSMGGIVEEFLGTGSSEVHSPSVQLRIRPDGSHEVLSTHDQVLAGVAGQAYVGCRFPASAEYRADIQADAVRVAEVLARQGVVSRLAVDFLVWRSPGGDWQRAAIEINLRMGGTTHPLESLRFLTAGEFDAERGIFVAPDGTEKFYFSTDALTSTSYRGLLPEDFLQILTEHSLNFDAMKQTGVLFHMIGALSQYGKVGVTCIGNDRKEADEYYQWTVKVLDRATGATGRLRGRLRDPFHERAPVMD